MNTSLKVTSSCLLQSRGILEHVGVMCEGSHMGKFGLTVSITYNHMLFVWYLRFSVCHGIAVGNCARVRVFMSVSVHA